MVCFELLFLVFIDIVLCAEGFLENVERPDVNAVKLRLAEEKERRLLLENDVQVLMLKFARFERSINEESICPSDSKSGNVSFHASYSQGHLQVTKGQLIIFDNVVTNNGGGYSPSSGTFRAPQRGVYAFTANILVLSSKHIHAGIFKNGIELAKFFAGTKDGWSNSGTQSLVVNLDIGDEVFIQATVDGNIHGTNYCTFNGFLIKS